MEPTKELKQQLRQDKIDRARRKHPMAKAFGGIELFDHVCKRMKAGIRMQFPDADENEIDRIFKERQAKLDQQGY